MRSRCARAVVLLAIAGVIPTGCGPGAGGAPPAPQATAASPRAQGVSAAAPAAEAARVVIDNFAYAPRELTVAPGTRVTWVNRDDVPHTVTSSERPRALDSGALDTDDTFAFVFSAPGTYEYFCAVHPHMTGKVIVK
jgi:plastocyanin